MTINIFILMAGRGDRFRQRGFEGAKALISWNGRPLFCWSMESVRRLRGAVIYLVTCADDRIAPEELRHWAPDTRVIELPHRTRGPAETALQALSAVSSAMEAGPVIFCDCDLICRAPEWEAFVQTWSDDSAAALICFASQETKHSFVKTDAAGYAVAMAEKENISGQAVAGVYAFRSAEVFGSAVAGLDLSGSEKYISHVYQRLIADGKTIRTFPAGRLWLLGTPADLAAAEKFSE